MQPNFQIEAEGRDLIELSKALHKMGKSINAKAIARVTRAAAKEGADVVIDDVSQEFGSVGISRSKLRSAVAIAYFNGGSMTNDVIMSSGWFRLADHGLGRKAGDGLTNKLGHYSGAFKATMGSGHRGIFSRVGPKRFPIRELWGLNPMREVERGNSDALEHGSEVAAQQLEAYALQLLEGAA